MSYSNGTFAKMFSPVRSDTRRSPTRIIRKTLPLRGAQGTRFIADSTNLRLCLVYSTIVVGLRRALNPLSDVIVDVRLLKCPRVHFLLDLSEHENPLVSWRVGHEELSCLPP